jgi:hypothetical protein
MPPFVGERHEAFGHHPAFEHPACRQRLCGGVDVAAIGGWREIVIRAGHGDLDAAAVQRKIDRTAAIVTRSGCRVGDELALFGRGCLPHRFGDAPRAIGIEDQQAVARRLGAGLHFRKRLGNGPLGNRARHRIKHPPHEIGRRGIADVEPEARIEAGQVDQIGRCSRGRILPQRQRRSVPHGATAEHPGHEARSDSA